uniref:Putative secreted protein n=1 Tax=Anopheles marajoara TaxID=58244 RepID=A0A2M4CEE7_9DIPT
MLTALHVLFQSTFSCFVWGGILELKIEQTECARCLASAERLDIGIDRRLGPLHHTLDDWYMDDRCSFRP